MHRHLSIEFDLWVIGQKRKTSHNSKGSNLGVAVGHKYEAISLVPRELEHLQRHTVSL